MPRPSGSIADALLAIVLVAAIAAIVKARERFPNIAPAALEELTAFWNSLPSFITVPLASIWNALAPILGAIWEAIAPILHGAWKLLLPALNSLLSWLQGAPEIAFWAIISIGVIALMLWAISRQQDTHSQPHGKSKPGVRRRFSKKEREDIIDTRYHQQGGMCAICKRSIPKDLFEIDHIVPIARGGGNEFSNLQLLCSTCNRRKGAR